MRPWHREQRHYLSPSNTIDWYVKSIDFNHSSCSFTNRLDQRDSHTQLLELLTRIDGPIYRINNQLDHLQDHLDRRRSDTPQTRNLIDAGQIQSESKSYVGCRLNLISNITNESKGKPPRVRANGYCRIRFISDGEVTVFRLSCGSMACQARARAPSCRLRKTRR